jgi:predicted RNA-binding Zn ribbon-like protein
MRQAPVPLSANPGLPLKYIGGDPSVDLVNTVDGTARGLEEDRLAGYERLTRWAEGAGIVSPAASTRLRQLAANHPREADAAWQAADWLRWVLRRLFKSVATGEPPGAALDDFNDLLAEALSHLRVAPAPGPSPAAWDWQGAGENLQSLLWPVTWSAASLLTSPDARRLRLCAADGCGWMYVDRSRNRLRRWCEMETCGTREKSRRRYERSHAHGSGKGAAGSPPAEPGP